MERSKGTPAPKQNKEVIKLNTIKMRYTTFNKNQTNLQGYTIPVTAGTGYPPKCPKCKTNSWRNIKPRFHHGIPTNAIVKKELFASFSCTVCPPYYQPCTYMVSHRRVNVVDALCGNCDALAHKCNCKYDEAIKFGMNHRSTQGPYSNQKQQSPPTLCSPIRL